MEDTFIPYSVQWRVGSYYDFTNQYTISKEERSPSKERFELFIYGRV